MSDFDRQILVYVRDADNQLAAGATISWTEDGQFRGRILHSDGHGTLTIEDRTSIVEVTVEYEGQGPQTRRLALEQESCNFVFPELHIYPTWRKSMERHFPAFVGIAFVLIAIVLTFSFPNPTPLQVHIILAVLSLGGGAFGSEISGILKVDLTLGTKLVIGATGAAAIFVILFFVVPAGA